MTQISEQTQSELERRHRATILLIGAQILIVIILTLVAWFVVESAAQVQTTVTTILWGVILFIAIGAFLLRRMIFSPAVLRDTATLYGASGLLRNLQGKTLLIAGLGELVAIVGFIVAFLSGDKYDMLRAAAIALIIFFISFPRKSAWQRVSQAASK